MNNIIFHIGMPRTATTFLQQNIFSKMDVGLYPEPKPVMKENKIIISNEMLCMVKDRYIVLNKIKEKYPKAKILLGTRKYSEILEYLYNHLVTYGLYETREEWNKRQPVEMKKYIEYVKALFPEHYIYSFEDFKNNPDHIIKQICKFIDVDVPIYENKIVNPVIHDKDPIENMRLANTLCSSKYNPKGYIPRHFVTNIIVDDEKRVTFFLKTDKHNKVTFETVKK